MPSVIQIRNLKLGEGLPKICIPLTASNLESLKKSMDALQTVPCDLVEWRADFYENFQVGDSGYMNLPQLIIVCEDEKHMAETFKAIVINKVEISNVKLYFTTDLRQNEETLEKTLVEFKLDEETKKYRMENIEVKLLGL